jgi:hypothetical protein
MEYEGCTAEAEYWIIGFLVQEMVSFVRTNLARMCAAERSLFVNKLYWVLTKHMQEFWGILPYGAEQGEGNFVFSLSSLNL